MPLYTKFGDKGQTMLYGGKRVRKADQRVHAYGDVDELNALLGMLLAERPPQELAHKVPTIQHTLYVLGADLATPYQSRSEGSRQAPLRTKRITQEHVEEMERWIDEAEARVSPLTHFILPGGTRVGALLHVVRTVTRRAERWVVALSETEQVNPLCLQYLNRLGDFFFAAARVANKEGGVEEVRA